MIWAGLWELSSERILEASQRPLTYRLQAVYLLAKIYVVHPNLECQLFRATYVLKLLDFQLSFGPSEELTEQPKNKKG